MDALVDEGHYALGKEGELYVVYLPYGGDAKIDLGAAESEFEVSWFNPRTGGDLIIGTKVKGGAVVALGEGPTNPDKDWVALVKKI